MRIFLLFLSLLLLTNAYAEKNSDKSCEKKSIAIYGQFGKHQSPLIDQWSETAGNFTQLEIRNASVFSKITFQLKDQEGNQLLIKTFSLTQNKSGPFDLIKLIKESIIRPNSLTISIFQPNGNFFCQQELSIIQKDGQDGVLIKL